MIESLETDICRLVPLHAGHEASYIALANHPQIRERVNNIIPYEKVHFEELLKSNGSPQPHFTWVIEVEGAICGVINTGAIPCPERFQGGYWIDPAYWGRGIATAALKRANAFLFEKCNAIRIQALVEPDNAASIAVLEKCGYQREGLLKKFYPSRYRGLIDVAMFAIIKE